MDVAGARGFLGHNHHTVLLTYRQDGSPQLSPVLCALDDEGRAVISTRETAMKAKNLQRDSRASVCVFDDNFFGEWVQIDGRAEVVHLPEAMEPLVDYYRTVQGEHPDWDDYRSAMERERRVLVRITIVRAGPSASG